MDHAARIALMTIRECLREERYVVLPHFRQRMHLRGIVWPDIQAIIHQPAAVRNSGLDVDGREKWLISGRTADYLDIEVVCVLDVDEDGFVTVCVTVY